MKGIIGTTVPDQTQTLEERSLMYSYPIIH